MRVRTRATALVALEIVGAIAAATLLVAALEGVAAVGDLRALYLLAVLFVAVRRGGAAAAVTAFGSVLALNFFFVDPRHQLRISHSRDLVALVVFLAAALVVGRLAAQIRERTKEAQDRARLASVRAQEAALVARVASAVLAGARIQDELPRDGDIRVSLNPVPTPYRLVPSPSPQPQSPVPSPQALRNLYASARFLSGRLTRPFRPLVHGARRRAWTAPDRRRAGPVCHRLWQRGLVDLLRAGPRGRARTRPHAGGVHLRGRPGAALVDEARARGSDLIYFDMGHARRRSRSSGPPRATCCVSGPAGS